jgi:hypothetical protein
MIDSILTSFFVFYTPFGKLLLQDVSTVTLLGTVAVTSKTYAMPAATRQLWNNSATGSHMNTLHVPT